MRNGRGSAKRDHRRVLVLLAVAVSVLAPMQPSSAEHIRGVEVTALPFRATVDLAPGTVLRPGFLEQTVTATWIPEAADRCGGGSTWFRVPGSVASAFDIEVIETNTSPLISFFVDGPEGLRYVGCYGETIRYIPNVERFAIPAEHDLLIRVAHAGDLWFDGEADLEPTVTLEVRHADGPAPLRPPANETPDDAARVSLGLVEDANTHLAAMSDPIACGTEPRRSLWYSLEVAQRTHVTVRGNVGGGDVPHVALYERGDTIEPVACGHGSTGLDHYGDIAHLGHWLEPGVEYLVEAASLDEHRNVELWIHRSPTTDFSVSDVGIVDRTTLPGFGGRAIEWRLGWDSFRWPENFYVRYTACTLDRQRCAMEMSREESFGSTEVPVYFDCAGTWRISVELLHGFNADPNPANDISSAVVTIPFEGRNACLLDL